MSATFTTLTDKRQTVDDSHDYDVYFSTVTSSLDFRPLYLDETRPGRNRNKRTHNSKRTLKGNFKRTLSLGSAALPFRRLRTKLVRRIMGTLWSYATRCSYLFVSEQQYRFV